MSKLQGQIERITYLNADNGYTVVRLKVYGEHGLVTATGNLMGPIVGEILKMEGNWKQHPQYGRQFIIKSYQSVIPASVYGIRKYLGSGLIRGIGPKIAERITAVYAEKTLDIIETDIKKLTEIAGIGTKRVAMIAKAWQDQKKIRDIMLFLQKYDLSSGYAAKIFKQYGQDAIRIMKSNPYRLAIDIFGIGFITADRIAAKLGFSKDSSLRASAGILHVLHKLADEGHVYYPYADLLTKSQEILDVDDQVLRGGLSDLSQSRAVVFEDLNTNFDTFQENNKAVYLAKYHLCETLIAVRLKAIIKSPGAVRKINTQKALQWVQKRLHFTLAPQQTLAIHSAIENKVMVITGGPGTGKTTIIKAIIHIYAELTSSILLTAPTGRAAKRMFETTDWEAKTIHRLLEYSMSGGGFKKNAQTPLKCDLIIVDEASMIDTILMHHLLKAVPMGATMILVGDINQLPSIGPGSVLSDIITSGSVPVTNLNVIFRQARHSQIVVNAHKINQGFVPDFDSPVNNDCYFIAQDDPEKVVHLITKLVKERIPQRFGLDGDMIQVLTPMHKGVVGSSNLNRELQKVLNPGTSGINQGGYLFRPNDKVMQIKNNYDKEVFNGDIGRISTLNFDLKQLTIIFNQREVFYNFAELDEIMPAYAISIHKSQGSEYPAVIIPILMQHYILLQRNLIYTAMTRGKKLVVLAGSRKALAIGVKNDKVLNRFTFLKERLGP